MRARYGFDQARVEGGAPDLLPAVKTDFRFVRTHDARHTARVLRSVVRSLQDGAQSSLSAPTDSGLTYADGWRAAAVLAQLVAFDAIKPPQE